MKLFPFLFIMVLIGFACTTDESTNLEDLDHVQEMPILTISDTLDSATVELLEWDDQYDVYQGNYFSIEYPSNFFAAPLAPIITRDNYNFVDTDEATFISPDGEVAFFVYSPLWGGEPKSYLEQRANEEITSEKESKDESAPHWPKTIKWVTYADKDGKYTRSFVSTKTESTDLVFGIKSVNDAAYEKYKAAYLRFKDSLTQFADA